jgi:hypothetical protein
LPWPVRQLVLARDNWACLCCDKPILGRPYTVLLRKPRQVGGTLSPENLITVLAACGQRIRFDRDPADAARGYRLRPHQEPALAPVAYPTPAGVSRAWLLPDGSRTFDPPRRAPALHRDRGPRRFTGGAPLVCE